MVEHRPWALPEGPWVMTQWWRDLLFAHWPIELGAIRGLVPSCLDVDSFDGNAWVAVVPFRMTGVRPRFTPALPGLSSFAELNVRTYVKPRGGGKPGVYFWSLEADNPVAVAVARGLFHLPYMNAEMRCEERQGWIEYQSRRWHKGEPSAEFRGRYRGRGQASKSELVKWLTERYCLYTTDKRGGLYRGEIHHQPWPLMDAECEIEVNTMARAAGIELPKSPPLLHFARAIEVLIWPLGAGGRHGDADGTGGALKG
ncbi:MAG: DUF2071 domain-containing protein [Acidobacteria bacterium]|nr:DUF2071 domain-containing protein [Acidobacteriota bacterium]